MGKQGILKDIRLQFSIRSSQKGWIVLSLLFLILAVSTIIRLYGFKYTFSDENVYLYMAEIMTRGLLPYRDFFYAHPPLFIYTLSLFHSVFAGFEPVVTIRMFTLMFSIASAVLVFLITKKLAGVLPASLAVSLFVFSVAYYTYFAYALGFAMLSCFMLLSVYLYMKREHISAGISMSFAVLSRLFGVFICLTIFLDTVLDHFSNLKYQIGSRVRGDVLMFGTASAVVLITFLAFATFSDIFNQVFLYHLSKPSMPLYVKLTRFSNFMVRYWHISLPAIASIYFFDKKDYRIIPLSLVVVASGILAQRMVFPVYFSMLIPLSSIACGYLFYRIYCWRKQSGVLLLVFFLTGICLQALPQESGGPDEGFLLREFPSVLPIAEYLAENTGPGDTVDGYSSVASLFALLAHRDMHAGFIDTNWMRMTPSEYGLYTEALDVDNASFIICLRGKGICREDTLFYEYLDDKYRLKKSYTDPYRGEIDIWQRSRGS